jgi:hypothetical protein
MFDDEIAKTQLNKIESKKVQVDDEFFYEGSENDNTEQIEQAEQKLPEYNFIGDNRFISQIEKLFDLAKLPRFVILNGKNGIGKFYGTNIVISKIFEKYGFICDLTIDKNQSDNPDVLYIKNISKTSDKTNESELKSINKNSITLKDHVEVLIRPFIQRTAIICGIKFVVIDNIDNLSKSVANSMLKTLEEADKSLFIVGICHDISKTLKTIRSRGIIFNIKPPSFDDFIKILFTQGIIIGNDSLVRLYNVSAYSPSIAKILVKSGYEDIIYNIEKMIFEKKPIKIEQIDDILLFCLVCEFALKNLLTKPNNNPKIQKIIEKAIEKINTTAMDYSLYNTTTDLAKILILKEIFLLSKVFNP